MITLRCTYEEEVRAACAALADGTLAAVLGGRDLRLSIWLDDTYRGGSPGTETGPEHLKARGRHALGGELTPAGVLVGPAPRPRRRLAAVRAALASRPAG